MLFCRSVISTFGQLLGFSGELSRTGSQDPHVSTEFRRRKKKLKKKRNDEEKTSEPSSLSSTPPNGRVRPLLPRNCDLIEDFPLVALRSGTYPSPSELAVLGRSPGPPGAATTGRT